MAVRKVSTHVKCQTKFFPWLQLQSSMPSGPVPVDKIRLDGSEIDG